MSALSTILMRRHLLRPPVLRVLVASVLLSAVGVLMLVAPAPVAATPLQAAAGATPHAAFSLRATSLLSPEAARALIRARAAHECGYRTAHQGFLDGHAVHAERCIHQPVGQHPARHQCVATISCTNSRKAA